ncbi:MAG TPA: acetyl-CoA carboxylase carboxyltransferase subunit alpha/beta [Chloroflexota bacterium]|nr:acetyl-CoA carboxylase carboxyltransferase subunit alpha/beta [Chloroflexota bacterium]
MGATARERLAQILDRGSFREFDRYLTAADPLHFTDLLPYPERLKDARASTGAYEAVITGRGRIDGRPCVIAVLDFAFLGGSMGSVVGEKVTRALERAAKDRLPFIALTASGGARMQEGMLSLSQMAKTAAAAAKLRASGALVITVLTHPTTGGVYASFATQADVLLAEPGALIGFAGPRVIREVLGEAIPPGFQTAEFLFAHGLIDAIVDRPALRGYLSGLLYLGERGFTPLPPLQRSRRGGEGRGEPGNALTLTLSRRTGEGRISSPSPSLTSPSPAPLERGRGGEATPPTAWETVQLARHPERPTAGDYLARLFSAFVELHGDRASGDDPAVVGGLGSFNGQNVVVIAQERGRGAEGIARRHFGRVGPAGYRKARRLMDLAERLGLPLLTFIDTPGAEMSVEAEAGGLAQCISDCLARLATLRVPVVAAVIGEGGSGGALALGVADRVLILENALYAVIAPEGAAAILYRSKEKAPDVAAALKLTARDCLALGIVDQVVAEPLGGAHRDPDRAAALVGHALAVALGELNRKNPRALVESRERKFRRVGTYENRHWDRLRAPIGAMAARFADIARRLGEQLKLLAPTATGGGAPP